MQILVACEESQAVTIALRKLGHEAYSCDLIPCSGGHPEWHIQQDVLPLLNGYCFFKTCDGSAHYVLGRWDMLIAFPPCTYLTNASAVRMRVKGEIVAERYALISHHNEKAVCIKQAAFCCAIFWPRMAQERLLCAGHGITRGMG